MLFICRATDIYYGHYHVLFIAHFELHCINTRGLKGRYEYIHMVNVTIIIRLKYYFQSSIIFLLPYIIIELVRLIVIFYVVITSMILIKTNVLDFLLLILISVIGVFLLRKYLNFISLLAIIKHFGLRF